MIEDILLDVWGTKDRQPTEFQRHAAAINALAVQEAMAGPNPRTRVKAALRVAYFDVDAKKTELATARIFGGSV